MKASVKSSGLQTIGLCGGHYAIINKENKWWRIYASSEETLIDEAIKDYTDILYMEEPTRLKGKWNTLFPEPENPIHVEFGTGKGRFISAWQAFILISTI